MSAETGIGDVTLRGQWRFLNDMNGVQSKTSYRVLTGLAYAFEVPR